MSETSPAVEGWTLRDAKVIQTGCNPTSGDSFAQLCAQNDARLSLLIINNSNIIGYVGFVPGSQLVTGIPIQPNGGALSFSRTEDFAMVTSAIYASNFDGTADYRIIEVVES